MHREVSMHESRPEQQQRIKLFGTHRGSDCRICIDYTSIYYCCKSFPVLLYHNVIVGGWVASWVSLPYCRCKGLWVGILVLSCRPAVVGFSSFSPAIPAPRWHSSALPLLLRVTVYKKLKNVSCEYDLLNS